MMMNNLMADLSLSLPGLVLVCGTFAALIAGLFLKGHAFKAVSYLSLVLWAVVGVMLWRNGFAQERDLAFSDMLQFDGFAQVLKSLILLGGGMALLVAIRDAKDTVLARFEYPVLMGFSILGMFLMVSANDFMTLYVGLELSSFALYILAAMNRNMNAGAEAGLKYFILGALSSGLLLFGVSFIYGFTGALQFDVVGAALSAAAVPDGLPLVPLFGLVLVVAGLAFKISAVPFHMWTPDVYDGAPAGVTAFFAIVPKIAAMALIVRLVTGPFVDLVADWQPLLILMAVLSMTVGALAGLVQKRIRRLLAYSSIGNMGYALIGVAIGTQSGLDGMLVYISIYMVMTAAVFACVLSLRQADGSAVEKISDLNGLSSTHPVMAYIMAGLMFSLAGIPPLAGFFSKLYLFEAAVAAEQYALAVFGVVTSVVAAWYYLNIIRVMFFEKNESSQVEFTRDGAQMLVITLGAGFTALFVLFPAKWLALAYFATASLTR